MYPGAKWALMPRLMPYIPRAPRILDAFCGSGAFALTVGEDHLPRHLILNDIYQDAVNLLRVCRERPDELARLISLTPWSRSEYDALARSDGFVRTGDDLEDARRYLIITWQRYGRRHGERGGWSSGGSATHRAWSTLPERIAAVAAVLVRAEIECKPALELIQRYATPDTLIYADPPYVAQNIHGRRRRIYQHEMDEADHVALLDALGQHPGPVLLSGYRCALYDERLAHWHRVDFATVVEQGERRTESVWLNTSAQNWGLDNRQTCLIMST
jgi:DNA adenine methylase